MMSMHLLTYFRIMHLMWTNLSQPPSLNLHVPMLSLVSKITDFNFLDFYASQDQEQIFQAMRVSSEGIVEIFRDCNLNVIFNNFGLLFDGLDIDFKTEDVEQALRVAFEFASFIPDRPRPDECPSEGEGEYGLIRLNCMERFENATTKCQIRKRWACNFAEWRFNFLRTWLSKFYQQYGDRDLPVPSCGNDEEYVRCKSG